MSPVFSAAPDVQVDRRHPARPVRYMSLLQCGIPAMPCAGNRPCDPCVNLSVTGAIRWTACFRTWSGSCRARCGMSPGRKWWSCTRSGALSASDATDLRHDDNTFVRHRETARQPCQPRRRPCTKRYRISHPTLRQPHRSRMPQIAAQAMDLTELKPGNPQGIPRRAPCACADFSGTMRPRNA